MTYTPDEQDTLVGEAMALGGRGLVNELSDRAARLAALVNEWDGVPPEPPHYKATWLLSFRQFLDQAKAGGLTATPDPPPIVTSDDGKAALAHERQMLAEALRTALDTLTDTELREYLDGLVSYLRRRADDSS